MEQQNHLPVLPKKVWSILRLFYFMLRKGVSKNKIWLDVNMMIKRAKIAGKAALQNLLFHHHNWPAFPVNRRLSSPSPPPRDQYEYTPNSHKFSLFSYHKKHNQPKVDAVLDIAAVLKAMEMIHSETTSPVVRQLRVTDSPFRLSSVDEDDSHHVDEAAEEFIIRFYDHLQRQKQICGGDTTVL